MIIGSASTFSTAELVGDIQINRGATLGGHGSIAGNVDVRNGAIIAPGNSIGTLTVSNITFNPGSIFEVEVNPQGQSDKLLVTDTATLNGGVVDITSGATSWQTGATYTILEVTANPITGQFDGVTNRDLLFLSPQLDYTLPNLVRLRIARSSLPFATAGTSYNQRSTAWGIESLGLFSKNNPVYNTIANMSLWQASHALDNLSGEIHASVKSALLNDTRYTRNAINQHLEISENQHEKNLDISRALWVSTWYHDGHLKDNGNAARLDNKGWGVLLGLDAYNNNNIALGVALGYEKNETNTDNRRQSDADANAYHLLAYAKTAAGPINIQGSLGYSLLNIDSTRHVAAGSLYSKNTASYNGSIIQAFVRASHTFSLTEKASLSPYLSLAYQKIKTDSFNEKGANLYTTLHQNSSSDDVFSTTLGLRGDWQLGTSDSSLYAELGWQHYFGNRTPQAHLNFLGGTRYTLKGTELNSNAAQIGLGANIELQRNMRLRFGYDGLIGNQSRDHSGHIQWEFQF